MDDVYFLSVVIPAFNEAERLGPTLARIRDHLAQAAHPAELIVVDDGSRDGTAEVVRQFERGRLTVRLLSQPRNRGKGYSVRQGVLSAGGDVILVTDADLAVPIDSLGLLLDWLAADYDVVIGSRYLPASRLDPPQPPGRRLLAAVFRTVRRWLLVPEIRDTQCGFKLYRRPVARQIFARQRLNGWLFDCEVLALARAQGFRVKEVGVVWRHQPGSRLRWLPAAAGAPLTLLRLWWRMRRLG
jgi:dolichyl-phosphate beta-glucosyltransferase